MKTVILAGGMGSRLAEETDVRPKPMVEIGGRPILWHIMERYSRYGHKEFLLALGYKSEIVKRFFMEYSNLLGSMSIDLARGQVVRHDQVCEDWTVHLMDTGQHTNTGGRVKRLEPWLKDGTFLVTYGDGLADIDIGALVRHHRAHGVVATVTAVRPPARFGGLVFSGDRISHFTEKPQSGEGWINGGFLVCEPTIFDYLQGDHSSLEGDVLEHLAAKGLLAGYRHEGFWQCMDTLRDKRYLESLCQHGSMPWTAAA